MFNSLNALPILEDDGDFLSTIVSIESDEEQLDEKTPKDILPILPLRDMVLFPGVVIPINIEYKKSIEAINFANDNDRYIGVMTQKEEVKEEPNLENLYEIGTVAKIVKVLKMPNDATMAIIHGRHRFKIKEVLQTEPYLSANIEALDKPDLPLKDEQEFYALIAAMKEMAHKIIELSPQIPSEAVVVLKNIDNPEFLIHFICSNLDIEVAEKQELLIINDLQTRAERVLVHLNKALQMVELKNKINNKVRVDIDKQQRDYFLHQQLKIIQEELDEGNGSNSEAKTLIKRARKMPLSNQARKVFDKEMKKFQRMNPAMPEHAMALTYLEFLLDLPWEKFTTDRFKLKKAKQRLDRDHYGLEKVKNRILEFLAVLHLKSDSKSPILCFVGPPGVGKTSLGRSIAKALKRKYVRMSLGGLRDEAEIRGHRRTYIGARPGRIIQSLKKVQSSNPLFILDELDKIGNDFRGDPAAALLEVLDPEQNHSFYDNYLEVEYDLSNVLFIATANSLNKIHPALRDRMEIVYINGYSLEEKVEIARRHLVPKQRKAHGLANNEVRIPKKILAQVIREYTRESGVRELERKIAALMRTRAKQIAFEEKYKSRINTQMVAKSLGLKRYDNTMYASDNPAGVSIGLAWTQVGGDILYIESSLHKGKGELTLTGNLGKVMKESAKTALSYIKSQANTLAVDDTLFGQKNFHIHVPEGAIPKDGPSAGIALFSALISAITGQKVKPFLAMTGEITLRGKVLPVGGIKEKILAARRAGLKEVVLCYLNQKDVEEINPTYRQDLQFHYVKNMMEVYQLALNS